MSKEKVMNPSIRLYRNFIFPRLLKRITFFFMMLFSWVNESSAILSAQTVNKIIGNAPEIRQTADEKVLNGIQFKLKIDGLDPAIISPGTANKISVAYNTSPSLYSFGIDTSSLNDSDIYDVDGDKIANVDSFIIQSINAEWRDQNDNIIPSDSTAPLGCEVSGSPY